MSASCPICPELRSIPNRQAGPRGSTGIRNPTMQRVLSVFRPKKPTVHAVHLSGVISSRAGPRGISFQNVKPQLEAAFKGTPEAVALVVNSPGGSPTQCSLIGDLLDSLQAKTKVPVISFSEDLAASGGYWLLCAGQEVYCDKSSIVGSIGVVSANFGVHNLIERYGIERRILAAGRHKVRLDPFLPQVPEDVEKMQDALCAIHDVFKQHVRSKRGAKIEGKEEAAFSGDFWVGAEAVEMGLVDKVGTLHAVGKEKFGDEVVIRDILPKPRFPFLPPWLGGASGAAAATGPSSLVACVVEEALTAVEDRIEERLWRSRVGL